MNPKLYKDETKLRINISGPSQNGISSLTVSRGYKPVFTALAKDGKVVHAWFTQWVTDFDRAEANETTRQCWNPEPEVRRMLGSLAGA